MLNISQIACIILLLMCMQITLRYIKSCSYDVDACMRNRGSLQCTHTHTQAAHVFGNSFCSVLCNFFFLSLEVFEIIKDPDLYKSSL